MLPALVADVEAQLAPLSDNEMRVHLTGIMASLGTGIPQKEKTEWMGTAAIALSEYPAGLTREALQDAVTACESIRGVLKHVRDYCEHYPAALRTRLERLQQLQMIAEEKRNV